MAITPIWESGWELGRAIDELTSAPSATVSASNPKTGSYRLSMPNNSTTYQEHTASISQCQVGMHVSTTLALSQSTLFALRQGTTFIVVILWDPINSQWVVSCGGTEVARVTDIPFATTDLYHHVGVDIKIDASTGWVYLWRDGIEIISFDGDTDSGGTTFNRLYLGGSGSWNGQMDNNVWYDTTGEAAPVPVPDYRLEIITPNGDGNYSEWVGSDGNSVNNSLLVDEVPHNSDTDYVTTATANATDSYAMTTLTIPSGGTVVEVIPIVVAKKMDALGTMGLKIGTRYSGTDLLSSTKLLGTGYTTYRERQATKPGGGAWDQASLDAVEIEIEAAV